MIDPKYNSLKWKYPTKEEFSQWTPDKWMDYLRFTDFFIEKVKKGYFPMRDTYVFTPDKLSQIKIFMEQSDHPWLEFIARIGIEDNYGTKVRFFLIQAMKFLEIRPALVTQDMKLLMRKNPFLMGKYLRVSPIVEAPPVLLPAVAPTIQSVQIENLADAIGVVTLLVKKIKKEGVDDMSVKEMISALPKIVDAINKMQGKATKIGNLTLINTQASVEDMESQMLSMVGKQNNE